VWLNVRVTENARVLSARTPLLDRADFNEALAAFRKAKALKSLLLLD
jgi:hypothetical protein